MESLREPIENARAEEFANAYFQNCHTVRGKLNWSRRARSFSLELKRKCVAIEELLAMRGVGL